MRIRHEKSKNEISDLHVVRRQAHDRIEYGEILGDMHAGAPIFLERTADLGAKGHQETPSLEGSDASTATFLSTYGIGSASHVMLA